MQKELHPCIRGREDHRTTTLTLRWRLAALALAVPLSVDCLARAYRCGCRCALFVRTAWCTDTARRHRWPRGRRASAPPASFPTCTSASRACRVWLSAACCASMRASAFSAARAAFVGRLAGLLCRLAQAGIALQRRDQRVNLLRLFRRRQMHECGRRRPATACERLDA